MQAFHLCGLGIINQQLLIKSTYLYHASAVWKAPTDEKQTKKNKTQVLF